MKRPLLLLPILALALPALAQDPATPTSSDEPRAKVAGARVLSAETPLADVLALAEAGEAAAQYELAYRYMGGVDGAERNLEKAAAWCRKAADQGIPDAWFALGEIYARPEFAGRDFAEAKKWYLKAAESGDARIRSYARNALGTSYEYGTLGPLVERDLEAAERWYRKAMESWTNAVAERNLGCLFASGKDRYLDDGKAVRRLFSAAAGDTGVPIALLCGEFGMPLPPALAESWARYCRDWEEHWRTSGGDPYDEWIDFAFGALREHGVFLEKDAAKAVEWYRKSAEHGLPRAQMRLAELLWTGTGVEKDERAALDWIRKAAADGSEKAKELLALHESGDRPVFESALLALRPCSWEELKKSQKHSKTSQP